MAKRTHTRDQRESKPKNRRMLYISLIAIVAIVIAALLIVPNLVKSAQPIATRPNQDGMQMGDPNAAVKVEEYSDFQCPYCGNFSRQVEPGIVEKYITTGKVHFTFIPFSFLGAESVRAAEAAFCAADQNKFWEFKEIVFANQAGENQGAFIDGNLIRFAQQAGLKMTDFRPCFDNGKYSQKVQDDVATGRDRGVNGTPYFFVNGKGPVDQNGLATAIENALAGK
jgi:protein-disulfide isomerase